ncbi:DUF7684 family protein [Methylobacterium sp. sgz302541]|uniref:DUF7684 family protein n=1 Tax=unclassified Methylobacterium TaxID=2615210 RepID=UPI003D329C4F
MDMDGLTYIGLSPGQPLPILDAGAYRAVVVIDEAVTDGWRDRVSEWLVRSGCLYMLAWGDRCSEWDDSVDHANLAAFGYGEVPTGQAVMTTWHEEDTLAEVFRFAANHAHHPSVGLTHTLIVHITHHDRETEFRDAYRAAAAR